MVSFVAGSESSPANSSASMYEGVSMSAMCPLFDLCVKSVTTAVYQVSVVTSLSPLHRNRIMSTGKSGHNTERAVLAAAAATRYTFSYPGKVTAMHELPFFLTFLRVVVLGAFKRLKMLVMVTVCFLVLVFCGSSLSSPFCRVLKVHANLFHVLRLVRKAEEVRRMMRR